MAYGHSTLPDDWFVESSVADPQFSVTSMDVIGYIADGGRLANHGDFGLRVGPDTGTFDLFAKDTLPISSSYTGTGASTVTTNEFEDSGFTFTSAHVGWYVEILNAVDADTLGLHLISSVAGGKATLNHSLATESSLDWNLRAPDTAPQSVRLVTMVENGQQQAAPLVVASRQNPFTPASGYRLGMTSNNNLGLVHSDDAPPFTTAAYVTDTQGEPDFDFDNASPVYKYLGLRLDTWREGADMRIRAYILVGQYAADTMLSALPLWRPAMDLVHQVGVTTPQVVPIPDVTQNVAASLIATPTYAGAAGAMVEMSATAGRYIVSPQIIRGA